MEQKRWFLSKGMWGGIGTILGGIWLLWPSFAAEEIIAALASNLEAFYVLATGILATVGRAVANTKISQ